MHVGCIYIGYACQCLYVVAHALCLVGVIFVTSCMVTRMMIEMAYILL